MHADRAAPADRPGGLDRLLEYGLAALLVIAPLPFGAVGPRGRLVLELGAFLLLVIWAARALFQPTPLPSRLARAAIVGLLCLAVVQLLPLGDLVARLSPAAAAVRENARPPAAAREAEQRLLGIDPRTLDASPTLSVDPLATASALRTGAALAALFFVATTVAARGGARRIALALLVSAAFQAGYGLMVLTSGHARIWTLPKEHYLDCATGTFINRNHFASYLAMALACGLGLILERTREAPARGVRRSLVERLAGGLDGHGSRKLVLILLLAFGLAGLLASFSRAGIAFGAFALGLTLLSAGRLVRLQVRVMVALLVAAAAAAPLVQIGSDRLVERFSNTADDLTMAGARARVWLDTARITAAFPVFGSGFGSFAAVYPLYRAPEVRLYYAHAHNDLLQAVAESGGLGLALIVLLLIPLVATTLRSCGGAKGTLAIGFAAGLVAVLLHGLVDFNFHIPANAATAAVLAGALQGLPWNPRS